VELGDKQGLVTRKNGKTLGGKVWEKRTFERLSLRVTQEISHKKNVV